MKKPCFIYFIMGHNHNIICEYLLGWFRKVVFFYVFRLLKRVIFATILVSYCKRKEV